MTDLAGWYAADDLSPIVKAQAFEQMSDAREAAAERREQAEREAARESRLEALQFANRTHGNPIGELQRARIAFEQADDQVRDLSVQLAKAEAKRSRAESSITFHAQRMQEASQLATRSAGADLLSPAREAMAEVAAQRVERMLAEASVSRPKGVVSRSGYVATRSDQPIDCVECQEAGVPDWETSVLIHKQAEMDGVELGQRSRNRDHGPMIFR